MKSNEILYAHNTEIKDEQYTPAYCVEPLIDILTKKIRVLLYGVRVIKMNLNM